VLFFLTLLAAASLGAPCAAELARFEELRPRWAAVPVGLIHELPLEEIVKVSRALRTCEGADPAARSRAFNWETYALTGLGRFEENEAAYGYFFSELADVAPPRDVVRAYRGRAMTHVRAGQPLPALRDYVAALPYAEGLAPEDLGALYFDLAAHYYQLRDLDRAASAAEQAIAGLAVTETPRQRRTLAQALHIAAVIRLDVARAEARPGPEPLAEAFALLARSRAHLDPAEDPRLLAFSYTMEADAHALRGDLAAALDADRQALAFAQRTGEYSVEVQVSRDLGRRLHLAGRPDEALAVLSRALTRTGDEARWLADVHFYLGVTHEGLGRFAEAERHYRSAVEAKEAERAGLGVSEWVARAEMDAPHRRLIALLLRQQRAGEAFLLLDATRARYLSDLQAATRAPPTDPSVRAHLDSLRATLRALRAEVRANPMEASPLALRADRLEAEIAELTGLPPHDPAPATLAELQRRLEGSDRVVLSYFLDQGSGRYDLPERPYVFVLTEGAFHAVPLRLPSDSVRALVEAAGLLAEGARQEAFAVEAGPLRRLYDALFRPLEGLVPRGAPVTVIPEGALAYLPFGMLVDGEAARFQYHAWPFLLRRHAFSTELAVSLLGGTRPARAGVPLLAFGRSTFEGVAPPSPFPAEPLRTLAHVPAELAALGRIVPRARLALDAEARPSALLAEAGQAQVLHLASHAFAHPTHPLYGAVLLGPDGPDHDGALFLYDLIGLDIPAALVVLSGCETARGPQQAGEGLRGMQYAFRAAGAQASLAMRWQVDDAATVFLMERFYRYLRQGRPKDLALQRAQLDYLAAHDRLQASPFFWAAADLSGSVEPLDWRRGGLPPLAWVALGLALLAAALASSRLRPSHG
jgi:CHAT domain-containing protein